jgi:virginiamycin B lyase
MVPVPSGQSGKWKRDFMLARFGRTRSVVLGNWPSPAKWSPWLCEWAISNGTSGFPSATAWSCSSLPTVDASGNKAGDLLAPVSSSRARDPPIKRYMNGASNDGPGLTGVLAKISIPGSPDWVAVDRDAVWISNLPKNNIARIDPTNNKVVATVPVGHGPCSGLGVGFGSVWVPCCGDRRIDRVDVTTNQVVASIATTIADSEGAIGVGGSGVWMTSDLQGTLLHIDPATNRIVARVKTVAGSFATAADEGTVWVTSTEKNLLCRVDPASHEVVAQIPVGPAPRFLAVGQDAVWTLNQGDGTVSRIDPATNQVAAVIAVGTLITERPPHRTVRAQFGHTAPTLGV